jgi:ATPase subunit of ABC transporter with duplicated ATPase domains
MPLLIADKLSHAFCHLPLLADGALQIDAGERIAIVGSITPLAVVASNY